MTNEQITRTNEIINNKHSIVFINECVYLFETEQSNSQHPEALKSPVHSREKIKSKWEMNKAQDHDGTN